MTVAAPAAAKLAYSITEAIAASGLSRGTIERAIAAGDLEARASTPKKQDAAHGGKRVILASELQRYLESLEVVS